MEIRYPNGSTTRDGIRNISATPDSELAYHKLLSRFMANSPFKVNELYYYSVQESGISPVFPLSECPDDFRCARSESPLSRLMPIRLGTFLLAFSVSDPITSGAENEKCFIGDQEQEYTDST